MAISAIMKQVRDLRNPMQISNYKLLQQKKEVELVARLEVSQLIFLSSGHH